MKINSWTILIFFFPAIFIICNKLVTSPGKACSQIFMDGKPPLVSFITKRLPVHCYHYYASALYPDFPEPVWSAEHLTREQILQATRLKRTGKFSSKDPILRNYRNAGFVERGHMTPSGDAPTPETQQETFTWMNVVPQTPQLNRFKWNWIEQHIRHYTIEKGEIFVVTGPLFDKKQKPATIGYNRLPVPSMIWKAFFVPNTQEMGAYICQNNESPTCWIVSVSLLTKNLGIDPFPGVNQTFKEIKANLPKPEM